MRILSSTRWLAALAVFCVLATQLVGPAPARADTTVSDAVCRSGSTGTLRFARTSLTWGDTTGVRFTSQLSFECLGAKLEVVRGDGYALPVQGSGALELAPPSTGTWRLRLTTPATGGYVDLATVQVTVTMPEVTAVPGIYDITDNSPEQRRRFLQGIRSPNSQVRIAGTIDLDVSGLDGFPIAPGVQIIGDRSANPLGPRLFTNTFPRSLFMVGTGYQYNESDNVRITGIRLDGGQGNLSASSETADSYGVRTESSIGLEIDHSEIYGWRGAGVYAVDPLNRINLSNADTVWVHDNYIHHNQHFTGAIFGGGHGAGYGVSVGHGAYALIERNVFDYNRHAIMGDGQPGTGYLAYRNLILDHGGNNTSAYHTHIIDMHGTGCTGQCGGAGEYMDIEYNTVLFTVGTAIHLRGQPSISMNVAHNVFAHSAVWTNDPLTDAALHQNAVGLQESDNVFGRKTFNDRTACDFDGDGANDLFRATGVTWWYRSSLLGGRWVYLNQSTKMSPEVTLGDTDGNGRCDVVAGGETFYSAGTDVPLSTATTVVTGDFNKDGGTDLAVVGQKGSRTLPVATATGAGTFTATDAESLAFSGWAQNPGTTVSSGDLNNDGRTDIVLTPGPGNPWWYTIPIAFAQSDGTFWITNAPLPDFARWAQAPGARVVTGDFNNDKRTDIALTGGEGWQSVPVAFSNGDGTFRVTNSPQYDFAGWSQAAGSQAVAGDFNHDGRTDIALTPGPDTPWWYTMPVAFSNGDGSFRVTNTAQSDFAAWAQAPGAHVLAGDFNNDGRTDIALTPGPDTPWWYTMPVAFSNGDGTFRVTNTAQSDFAGWAQVPGAHVITGDFNGDKRTDIALTPSPGNAWWYTIPVAFSNGDGTFRVTNTAPPWFAGWAQVPGAKTVAGDVNRDGRTDLILTGANGWHTVPVALSNGNGEFTVANGDAATFATRSAAPTQTPRPYPGRPLPWVQGMSEPNAAAALTAAGYDFRAGSYDDPTCSLPINSVAMQDPPGGVAAVAQGGPLPTVTLWVVAPYQTCQS